MTFDPEEARRRVLPAQQEKIAAHQRMMDELDAAIGPALDAIARNDYADGGTIQYEDIDFADVRNRGVTDRVQRVARIIGQYAYDSDGPRVQGDEHATGLHRAAGPAFSGWI